MVRWLLSQEPPTALDDLVSAGILRAVPKDPLGGHYFVEDGVVQNSSLLDDQTSRLASVLQRAADDFKKQQDRWPNDLEEMVERGILDRLPPHPYKARAWRYDEETGTVE